MKKLMIIGIIILGMISCKKEVIDPVNNSNTTDVVIDTLPDYTVKFKLKIYSSSNSATDVISYNITNSNSNIISEEVISNSEKTVEIRVEEGGQTIIDAWSSNSSSVLQLNVYLNGDAYGVQRDSLIYYQYNY